MVARDRFVERQRLEIGPRLVPWIVSGQVINPRPAAVLGRWIPLADALPLPERGVRLDDDRRARQPSEIRGDRVLRPRESIAGTRQHFVARVERVCGIAAPPLEEPGGVAGAERP